MIKQQYMEDLMKMDIFSYLINDQIIDRDGYLWIYIDNDNIKEKIQDNIYKKVAFYGPVEIIGNKWLSNTKFEKIKLLVPELRLTEA